MRVGIGYDVHAFIAGRPLVLGGVVIPYEKGLAGHSDADVLLHAVMDALLGAAALGDIGRHFPDTDPQYQGVSSLALLEKTMALINKEGFKVNNIDGVIMAQKPRLAPYIPKMEEKIAQGVQVSPQRVNIKATTTEGLGFVGRSEGIAAQVICSLIEK